MVTVKFSHPHGDHRVGDTAEVDADTAKRLVRAGRALYATVPDAKEADGDREDAATIRARGDDDSAAS